MALKASMKILVVDTNANMRQNVKKLLSDIGFKNVKEAGDGNRAMGVIEESISEASPVEFVISEFDLEKMNAVDLVKKIKGNDKSKMAKFLLMTGDSDQQKMVQAIKAGVNNVIVKPFSADTLKEKIAKIFNQ